MAAAFPLHAHVVKLVEAASGLYAQALRSRSQMPECCNWNPPVVEKCRRSAPYYTVKKDLGCPVMLVGVFQYEI